MNLEKTCSIAVREILDLLVKENELHENALISTNQNVLEKTVKIVTDSRKVCKGDCFIALKGNLHDGHQFIPIVLKKEPTVIIFENEYKEKTTDFHSSDVIWLPVKNSRKVWALLVAKSFNNAEKDLNIYGVTGTNGKTSTVWMVRELLKKHKEKCTIIGTLGAWIGEEFLKTNHTTPDPNELFSIISMTKEKNIKHVVMEVSSHSLDQEKVAPLEFSGAAFTSFSRDHLDYHKNMEEYFQVKLRLFFEKIKSCGLCLFNSDVYKKIKVEDLKQLKSRFNAQIKTYGPKREKELKEEEGGFLYKIGGNDYFGSDIKIFENKTIREGKVSYFGKHAIENFICALVIAEHILRRKILPETWNTLFAVPGRLELISKSEKEPIVFVDYAHTPDGLEKTLVELKKICHGKLWTVFGCGGDRDRGKRPQMGNIAEKLSDMIIITSDNPRTENPQTIMDEILSGITHRDKVLLEADRKKAIEYAIKRSKNGDIILLAGKGHEDYQIIGTTKINFNDRIVAREIINNKA